MVGVALPRGFYRRVCHLLHIHFKNLVVIHPYHLVAKILVSVLQAKHMLFLPCGKATSHIFKLAGAEVNPIVFVVFFQKWPKAG